MAAPASRQTVHAESFFKSQPGKDDKTLFCHKNLNMDSVLSIDGNDQETPVDLEDIKAMASMNPSR
jgi:hypothetical protein